MSESPYIIRGGAAGRERLRILSRVMLPTTLRLFEQAGLEPGRRCLDVGCGGGDVAFELARLVGPEGSVVGIDMDEAKLELARGEAASRQLTNIEFRRTDVASEALASGFDFVYARFLLTHLKDPLATLTKMCAALRPGGVLAVEDIDFRGSFCHPDCVAYQRYVELYSQASRLAGADPEIGPKLPGMLADVGLAGVLMNVVQPAGREGDVKLVAFLTMECIADSVVAAELASETEVDQIIADLRVSGHDGQTVMSLPRVVQAWGRLAAAGGPSR